MWYVLTWPPTFCLKLRPPAQCIKPIRDHEFTLHGLWPADANGKTISCNITVPVDWDKLIRPIESRLKTFWPELKENQPKYSIWKHEWKKHGVCGGGSAKGYFDAAIKINYDLFTRGNLYNYLASSHIVPSDSQAYTQAAIIKAIQTVFPASAAFDVYLRCIAISSRNTTHGYLSEAILCTAMDGSKFVTCPQGGRPRNCDTYPNIVIPPRPPRRRESQSMGQRILRFDFVSRDPPQVGFESRVMGDYPLKPPAECIKPIRDHEFTLHGLWPADANGKTITCKIKVPVDYDKLFRPIEAQLNTFWPELKANQPKYSIWEHEWEKHGVCGLTTAEEYFNAAIKTNGLFTRGNLYNYLASSNIVSSDHVAYTQDDIIKAIQTVFAPAPAPAPAPPAPAPAPAPLGVYLRCTAIDSANTTHGYLSEAVVCTTMDGSNFVTCPPRARNCDKFPNIVIPPAPPR
ncbi:hypothetical protein CQW23_16217 [Capsicum baccatum]|uniref:Uncharacterized protein n=1 Tax=Capsicum baccatum TaxID=33114 RepID=A0A2G2WAG7_CAPBA|nr:hypothetical protein CQW23_16217 [Capsicum baccatum]